MSAQLKEKACPICGARGRWITDDPETDEGSAPLPYFKRAHWWSRLRKGPHVWGIRHVLMFCPWNGEEFWIESLLLYLGIGYKHIELGLGLSRWRVNLDLRWCWS